METGPLGKLSKTYQYLATTGPLPKGSLPIGALPTGAATGGGSFRGKSAAIAPPTIATDATAANSTFNMRASYEFTSYHGKTRK